MKVRLTKRARIWHNAGDTVTVSPAEAAFLRSVHVAVPVEEEEGKENAAPAKKPVKRKKK